MMIRIQNLCKKKIENDTKERKVKKRKRQRRTILSSYRSYEEQPVGSKIEENVTQDTRSNNTE